MSMSSVSGDASAAVNAVVAAGVVQGSRRGGRDWSLELGIPRAVWRSSIGNEKVRRRYRVKKSKCSPPV